MKTNNNICKKVLLGLLILFAGIAVIYIIIGGICEYLLDRWEKEAYETAIQITSDIKEIPEPDNSKVIEDFSISGVLSGNEGDQSMGGVILESSLSYEEITEYYNSMWNQDYSIEIVEDIPGYFEILEAKNLIDFEQEYDGDQYYMICSWGE